MILWTIRGGQVSLRLNFNDHIVLEGNLRSHSLWVSAKKFSAELSAKEIVTRFYAVSPVHAGPFQTLLTKTLLKMIYCFTPFYSNFEMSEMRIVSVRPDYVKLAGSPCFKSQSAYLTPQETSNIYANRGSIASGKKLIFKTLYSAVCLFGAVRARKGLAHLHGPNSYPSACNTLGN